MKTILVVDDSAVDRRLAGGLLERDAGWRVDYAVDGKPALERIRAAPPDVVVTDLMMPEMNGLELVAAIKCEHPFVPVILMTAKGSEEIAVRALEVGAASYVPKARLAQDLRSTVEQVLAAAGRHRSWFELKNHITHMRYTFELENDVSLIPSLVNYLQQGLTKLQLCDEAERLRVGVALETAIINAMVHGNLELGAELNEADEASYQALTTRRSQESPYKDRRVYLSATMTPSRAVYVIRDDGPGLAMRTLSSRGEPANLDEPAERGLLLMRTLMDEVSFNDGGNEVTLVKNVHNGE